MQLIFAGSFQQSSHRTHKNSGRTQYLSDMGEKKQHLYSPEEVMGIA